MRWMLIALAALGALLISPTDAATTIPCADPRGCPDVYVDENRLLEFAKVETRTFAETDCEVVEGMAQVGTRKLFRFTTATVNRGKGALVIPDPALYSDLFTFAPCHGHVHMAGYMAYRLFTPEMHKQWQQIRRGSKLTSDELLAAHPEIQVTYGRKDGWCVVDFEPYRHGKPVADISDPIWTTQVYGGCEYPNSGLSPSWADVYFENIPGQWIDVTNLAAGEYVLEAEVNHSRMFEESSYRNNIASVRIAIP